MLHVDGRLSSSWTVPYPPDSRSFTAALNSCWRSAGRFSYSSVWLILESWSGVALLTVNTGGQSVPTLVLVVEVCVGVCVSVEVAVGGGVGVSAAVGVEGWKPVHPVKGSKNTMMANTVVERGISGESRLPGKCLVGAVGAGEILFSFYQ